MTKRFALLCVLGVAAAGLLGRPCLAAGDPTTASNAGFFPFVIPWDDGTRGSAVDVSWLNDKPAGVGGYIVPKGGHFAESKTGKRVRFLGVSFTFESDFPTHADAEKVAAHLAKLGINIVRIHHHDADYGKLWDRRYKDNRHIDPDSRDRLDYLIYQLKRNGIYVDLNLHVSRQFTAADGFPASVEKIPFGYDKRVDYYDSKMIALQKEFARDYLAHVNPYTKLPYTQDPCVAMIEINNENSLVGDPWATMGAGLGDLPEPFRDELVDKWNGWLKAKYASDSKLQAAWYGGPPTDGPGVLNPSSGWYLEHQSLDDTMETTPGDVAAAQDAHFTINQIDGTDWHVQATIAGLDLHEGKTCTVSFQAKADAPRAMNVASAIDQADWHNIGLNATAQLGTDWQTFHFVYEPTDTIPSHSRISFVLGNQTGQVWIRGLQIAPGVPEDVAASHGALAGGNVDIPDAATKAERDDWIAFLSSVEQDYAAEMRSFLKNDLKVHANIVCSQISWGASAGLLRESRAEYADNHAYWQHPSFPGTPWDPKNWRIENTPMVTDLANGGGGTLLSLAEYRVAGKPYTISEYNEPAPNDYRCEVVPLIAAFAAAQDWDGIFLFDWGSYGENAANDKIQGFFATGSDPARAGLLPAAALMFRDGEIIQSPFQSVLHISRTRSEQAKPIDSIWKAVNKAQEPRFLSDRLSTVVGGDKTTLDVQHGPFTWSGPAPRSPLELKLEETGKSYIRVIGYDGDGAVVGYLAGKSIDLGAFLAKVDTFGTGFCSVTVTRNNHADPNKIGTGRETYLVTVVGQVENLNMGWNTDRTSVGDQWGDAPSQAEFVPATISVPAESDAKVYALDGSGQRKMRIASTFSEGKLTFKTDPAAQTIWYEVATK